MAKHISGYGIRCNEDAKFFGNKPIIVNLEDAEVVEEEARVYCITYFNKGNTNLSMPYFYKKRYGFMMDSKAEEMIKPPMVVEIEDNYSEIPTSDGSTFNMIEWTTPHSFHYFTLCKYGENQDLYALVPKEWEEEKATGGYKRKKKRKSTKRRSTKRKSTKRRSKQRKYKKTRRRR